MSSQTKTFILDLVKVLATSLILAGIVRWLVFMPFRVQGASMEENFHESDYLIIDRVSPNFSSYHRGEVIVFKFGGDWRTYYIKRIIALPQETIEIKTGKVYINDALLPEEDYLFSKTPGELKYQLKADEYFVMGDNRAKSSDSRSWGPIKKDYIVGPVFLRLFPLNDFKFF